jgi:hypothetical protein
MRPVTYSWLVVVVAVACAAIGWLGIAGWLALVVAAASVGMHVAGNAIGRLVRISAGIGAACGGVAGTAALLFFAASTPAGAVLGGLSSAVIGAIVGFLGASFVEIVRTSLREAIAAERGR